jgi:hypothetical protein
MYSNVEKKYQKPIEGINKQQYKKICNTIVVTFENNELYLGRKEEKISSAYYYGCDGYGRRKAYVTLTYSKNNNRLFVSIDVSVEGDLPENEANDLAVQLINDLRKQIE